MGVRFSSQVELLVQALMVSGGFTSHDLLERVMHTWKRTWITQSVPTIQPEQWTFCLHWLYQNLLPSLLNNSYSQTGETQAGEVEFKVGENSTRCPGSEDSHQS